MSMEQICRTLQSQLMEQVLPNQPPDTLHVSIEVGHSANFITSQAS